MFASMKKALMNNQQIVAGGLGVAVLGILVLDYRSSKEGKKISDLPP
jgi:hypothetical protein